MPQLYVIDTNVVVSAVIGGDSNSPPCTLFDAMLDGRVPFLLSADLLSEYREVLMRPDIADRHGLDRAAVDGLLARMTNAAYLRQPASLTSTERSDLPPHEAEGDEHIVALLLREPRAALISGDKRLLQALRQWREVLTPAEAAARFAPQPEGQV